jgi:hypothetical protein
MPLTCVAAPARWHGDEGPNEWLADTGSGYDLVEEAEVPKWHLEDKKPCEEELSLYTANGLTPVNHVIQMQVKALGENVDMLLLKQTPAVISIGKRCMELGYGFWWPPYMPPMMILPNGEVIELIVRYNVPYLVDSDSPNAAPAPVHMQAIMHAPGPAPAEVP